MIDNKMPFYKLWTSIESEILVVMGI